MPTTPSITLPTGGGAIRSIGEKFAANPVTGSGSVTVPIATSPTRSDFGPELALSYDSNRGNGPFGLGWDLSLPSISRKTEKGLPLYRDTEQSDVFILSEAEDLVPELNKDGSPFEDVDSVAGYLIHRYRPRIEGLFAKIERWTRLIDGDVHWRTISGSNVLTIYGADHQSRIVDPENPARIFSWLLCESRDDRGNAIIYEYKSEDAIGCDLSPAHEQGRGRKDDAARMVNRYIKRIAYGNRVPLLNEDGMRPVFVQPDMMNRADWMFEVVFDYGDHDDDRPSPQQSGPWLCRHDPFSTYRAGFEVRTYRLCRRTLLFHHFPKEPGVGSDCLVASTDFTYTKTRLAVMTDVIQNGYVRQDGDGYDKQSLPPLQFRYSEAMIDDNIHEPDSRYISNLPIGIDGHHFQWVDLDGEGITGILTEQGGAWYYKAGMGEGRFGPSKQVARLPSHASLSSGRQHLLDIEGDGRLDLVQLDGDVPGFSARTANDDWESFQHFDALPHLVWDDPNLRFIDVTGDGRADIVITEDEAITWFPSAGKRGFGASQRVLVPTDEAGGPRLVFSEATESIYIADMSGDGLHDIVRIRHGEVCYWPNLGYGRFGTKVTMDHAPFFDYPDQFSHDRIRLADIDGSGTTDLIYLGRDGVTIYFNESGNCLSPPHTLRQFPVIDDVASVQVMDLLGNGTACLVWSTSLPGEVKGPIRYVDLMGGNKPHLLVGVINNTGGEIRIHYAPSTKFYLDDKMSGRPWVGRLPFPVHVVDQVESIDHVSRHRFVTRYAYHDGYFDGVEREFRGFGMVEQWDSESFEHFVENSLEFQSHADVSAELFQPPITTRTWYHTGAFAEGDAPDTKRRNDFYGNKKFLPDPTLPDLKDADEWREALRSLKGLPLRQEVYSFDGTDDQQHPYSIEEYHYSVKQLQRRAGQRHSIFHVHRDETVSLMCERNPNDSRISHELTLEVDRYGNPLKFASVVYGRKVTDPDLPEEVVNDQKRCVITYSEVDYTADIDRFDPVPTFRRRVPYASRVFEITGVMPTFDLFDRGEIKDLIDSAEAIQYETVAHGLVPEKRLIAHSRTLFRDDALIPMPVGEWDSLGLVYRTFDLALTPGVMDTYYGDDVSEDDLLNAGYVCPDDDNHWWIPSGMAVYPPHPAEHFYIPIGTKDALGVETIATYDPYHLLVQHVRVTEASWNQVTAVNDYRTLSPIEMTDINGNRTAVEIDALGMVIKSAVMGKAGSDDGDTLADPTIRMQYELFNWMHHRQPNFVRFMARERHGRSNTRWQESYTYVGGKGGAILTKVQANPGKALHVDSGGEVAWVDADRRWIGNGRTILNNKGMPVRAYEPYFSTTYEFEDETVLREHGVTAVQFYDALGRNVRTEFPDGTLTRTELDPWIIRSYDANDTVTESQWYIDRGRPDPNNEAEPEGDPKRRAAWLAAKHASTPEITHLDVLGRPVYVISDYGGGKTSSVRVESDPTGRFSKAFDQLGRQVASAFACMAGWPIFGDSAEKGEHRLFQNVFGAMVKRWDEHGRCIRVEYDEIHRPFATFIRESNGNDPSEILASYTLYGDRHPEAKKRNLLGTVFQLYDQAGVITVPEVDFKGNPIVAERVLAKEYKTHIDWSVLTTSWDYDDVQAAGAQLLDTSETFRSSAEIDALGRPIQVTMHDGTVVLPTYNEANTLASLQGQIRGEGPFVTFLKEQDYDAKGQRQFALYGNDVIKRYFYDPMTFKLANMVTCHAADNPDLNALQNLSYTYDPVGNMVHISDGAQQTHFFNNAVVKAESTYEYDALYQLVRARGREHAGTINNAIRTHRDSPTVSSLPHVNDEQAMRRYTREYEYDILGNIKALKHRFKHQSGAGSGWTQKFRYDHEDDESRHTNRLVATRLPGDADDGPYSGSYRYDVYGNMTRMPHLQQMDWNFSDQLQRVDLGGGGSAYYVYGADGRRIRKVIERNGDEVLEWIDVGGISVFRRRRRSDRNLRFERCTVRIADNAGVIAQIDTKTYDPSDEDPNNPLNKPLIRYQYDNHLGSAVLETDEFGAVVSYEEYYPFGSTSYRSVKSGIDLSLKRYRFTGKELDGETGLYYFGARYYAPWLARWTSCDPAGFVSGLNLYRYCRNSPVVYTDPDGMEETDRCDFRFDWGSAPTDEDEVRQRIESSCTSQLDDESKRVVVTDLHIDPSEKSWAFTYAVVPKGTFTATNQDKDDGEVEVDVPDQPGDLAGSDGEEDAEPDDSNRDEQAVEETPKGVFRPTGQSSITTWDSIQRGKYVKEIAKKSEEALKTISDATEKGDAPRSWQAAEDASGARNKTRLQTQKRLSPGGRALSAALDGERSLGTMVSTYSRRTPSVEGRKPIRTRYAHEIARRIAVASGESRAVVKNLARIGRVAGPVGVALGAALGIKAYADAPESEKGRVAARETGSFIGGAIGATVGMLAGVALAGAITSLLATLGLIAAASGPIGWLALGLGLIGSIAVGAWFAYRGSQIGEGVYNMAH